MGNVTLKDYVNDQLFIEKMSMAFSDLRADYELSMDADKTKVSELATTHVDLNNQLSDLIAYSTSSSGLISGLRGTGKTHLMLLARDSLNQKCFTETEAGVLCIYLNAKRLNLPEKFDQELFNRIFSVFMYDEISKQLAGVLEQLKDKSLIDKLLTNFNSDKKKLVNNIQQCIRKLVEFKGIAHLGNAEFSGLSVGVVSETSDLHGLRDLYASIKGTVGTEESGIESEITSRNIQEITETISKDNKYINYLSTSVVRDELIVLMKLLRIKGVTLYIDEWEKISYNPMLQEYMSFYIDRILDDPIYCWISIVPYRGKLYYLDNGADLQHMINLDENLIYENSKKDQELCVNYFKDFVNKRLYYYFKDKSINVNLLFNNPRNFEKLVIASMGNSRDFGTMLLKCWSEYRAYRISPLAPGRPYQYISEKMVNAAIKNNGEKKFSNIQNSPNVLKVWSDLEQFCITKKSSHLAIKENRETIDAISKIEFSDLIYHRLLHMRKRNVPAKDTSVDSKLSIYALDFSSAYDLHAQERKIQFIVDYEAVHNKVRRYIYDPTKIIRIIQIQAGEVFPCGSCGEEILINKMAAAWNNNSCPYCGKKIRVDA